MLTVKPQGFLGHLADMLMLPLMYFLQGTTKEVPQRTHFWNNHKLDGFEMNQLDYSKTLFFAGNPQARKRRLSFIPLFRMPIFGGWKKFVVLVPVEPHRRWYVGWIPNDEEAGISRVPTSACASVRVTIGPEPVKFFGFNEHGQQIELVCLGEGRIGQAGIYAQVPLF